MVDIRARKLELKKQFVRIRGIDRIEKIEKAILLKIRGRYEDQITESFDPVLSQKIDCLNFLMEGR